MTHPMQPNITPIERLPALLRLWRWRYGLVCALPGLAAAALGMIGGVSGPSADAEYWTQRVPLPAAAFVALLGLALGWWFAGQRFAHYRAELREGEGVVLRSGVWWRSEVWIPTVRLQHLDVQQGPLDRRWGMASLSLHTAGSHDQHTRILGLPLAQAHALRDHLLPRQAIAHE
jgi:membrane protein YdbS with pleckstrin-like domain